MKAVLPPSRKFYSSTRFSSLPRLWGSPEGRTNGGDGRRDVYVCVCVCVHVFRWGKERVWVSVGHIHQVLKVETSLSTRSEKVVKRDGTSVLSLIPVTHVVSTPCKQLTSDVSTLDYVNSLRPSTTYLLPIQLSLDCGLRAKFRVVAVSRLRR